MSLSVQCSVVESFKFDDKNIRTVYIKDVGQCLISQDVYTAVGHERKNGIKVIQRLVPEKYKMRLGDAEIDLKDVENIIHTQPNTVLLKEPGLYCFPLRCKGDEAEPLMEWAVETVLPQEVRKLSSAIENHLANAEDLTRRFEAIQIESEQQ